MTLRILPYCVAAALAVSLSTVAFAQDTGNTAPVEQSATAEEATADPAPAEDTAAEPTPTEDAAPEPAADANVETQAAVETPPAPTVTLPRGINPPPEGMGQVVFFRPSRFAGSALRFTVRHHDADLGRLPNGRYFVHVTEPGIHEYEVGRNDTIRMEVEPGETYFVQNNISMGIMAGRAVLAPSDQRAFEAALDDMRPSDPIN